MPPTEMLNRNAPHTPPGTSPPDGPPAFNRARAARPPPNNGGHMMRTGVEVSGPKTLEL